MVIREDKYGQTTIIPFSTSDFISDNNICYFIEYLLDVIDLSKFKLIFEYDNTKIYSKSLIAVILHSLWDNIYDTNLIEEQIINDFSYLYFTRNKLVNSKLLLKFINNYTDELSNVVTSFRLYLKLCDVTNFLNENLNVNDVVTNLTYDHVYDRQHDSSFDMIYKIKKDSINISYSSYNKLPLEYEDHQILKDKIQVMIDHDELIVINKNSNHEIIDKNQDTLDDYF